MEWNEDMEMIKQAIHKLIEENRIAESSSDVKLREDDEQLLSRLLSQLDSLKESNRSSLLEQERSTNLEKSAQITRNDNEEDLVKELRAVKRQNTITHCLMSALILVTLIWELSEVSMILKIRNGINHPFKAFGSVIGGMWQKKRQNGTNDIDGGGNENKDDHHRNGEEQ